jgi:hypothetical protein
MSDLNVYTTSQINALTPITGDMVVDSDLNAIKLYDGSAWRTWNSDSVVGPFTSAYSVALDGADDRIVYDSTSGNQTSLGSFTGDMSFVLWFKQNTSPSTYEVLISSHHRLITGDGVQGKFDMDILSGGRLRTFSRDSNGGGFTDSTGGAVVNNSWNFVAHVVDTTASSHYTYIGSTSSAPTLANTISSSQTLEDFSNGFKLGDGYQANLGGYINDFAIFDGKALNLTEVQTIWNNGLPFNFANDASLNPVGWYRMGDDNSGAGTLVQNKVNTASSYNAELENGASFSQTTY